MEVVSYEARARELHDELQRVLGQLRASYDNAQQEKHRLAAHVASLERGSYSSTEGGEISNGPEARMCGPQEARGLTPSFSSAGGRSSSAWVVEQPSRLLPRPLMAVARRLASLTARGSACGHRRCPWPPLQGRPVYRTAGDCLAGAQASQVSMNPLAACSPTRPLCIPPPVPPALLAPPTTKPSRSHR